MQQKSEPTFYCPPKVINRGKITTQNTNKESECGLLFKQRIGPSVQTLKMF